MRESQSAELSCGSQGKRRGGLEIDGLGDLSVEVEAREPLAIACHGAAAIRLVRSRNNLCRML